ncbi:hypothetical protein ACJJTC_006498 [Scirpophaga incertulas]
MFAFRRSVQFVPHSKIISYLNSIEILLTENQMADKSLLVAISFLVGVYSVSIHTVNKQELEDDNDLDEYSEREGKILFPFVSIVRFANTDCASTNTMNGTCLARRECNDLAGTITGACANRRGRCCIVTRSCGTTTNVNNTYFSSPGYPAAYAGGGACSIIVNKCSSNVLSEFLDMVLAQPDGDGNCATDSITVSGGDTVVPTLCGDNTGQTIFVNFSGSTAITITVTATLATTFSRRWNMRLRQITCNCPTLAPSGCLQYYTGRTGTLRSFNYGAAANAALSASLVTGTRHLVNLNYGICIRVEAGYCAIQYAQSTGNALSFTLTGDVEGADNTVLGTAIGAVNNGGCTTDYVVIPDPTVATTGAAVGTDRFCGLGFVTIRTSSTPFVVYVVTDGNEGATAVSPPDDTAQVKSCLTLVIKQRVHTSVGRRALLLLPPSS